MTPSRCSISYVGANSFFSGLAFPGVELLPAMFAILATGY